MFNNRFFVVIRENDEMIRIICTKTMTFLRCIQAHTGSSVNSICLIENDIFISGGSDKSIRLWSVLTGE